MAALENTTLLKTASIMFLLCSNLWKDYNALETCTLIIQITALTTPPTKKFNVWKGEAKGFMKQVVVTTSIIISKKARLCN